MNDLHDPIVNGAVVLHADGCAAGDSGLVPSPKHPWGHCTVRIEEQTIGVQGLGHPLVLHLPAALPTTPRWRWYSRDGILRGSVHSHGRHGTTLIGDLTL